MVYTSFEDLSYFFFFSLWSFDTNKKEKVIKYKWSYLESVYNVELIECVFYTIDIIDCIFVLVTRIQG